LGAADVEEGQVVEAAVVVLGGELVDFGRLELGVVDALLADDLAAEVAVTGEGAGQDPGVLDGGETAVGELQNVGPDVRDVETLAAQDAIVAGAVDLDDVVGEKPADEVGRVA